MAAKNKATSLLMEDNQWPMGTRPNPCCGYSCNGINVYGDEKSMKAVKNAFHDQGNLAILRGLLAQHKQELLLRNQEIEDLSRMNRISQKILEDRRKAAFQEHRSKYGS